MKDIHIDRGPYGLRNMDMYETPLLVPLRAQVVELLPLEGISRHVIAVRNNDNRVVFDGIKDGEKYVQEALEWVADLVGAATGLEVEIKDAAH